MAKKQFKAESKRLLDLMINSIYTNKEIFLRELISNASDALDKRYYQSLTDTSLKVNKKDLTIHLVPNLNDRTLIIEDTGIGMTKKELEENLGTIARSGSSEFKAQMEKATKNVDIIGQFGVGFYSAFMVASKIQVLSKTAQENEATLWESSGEEGYTVTPSTKDTVGTRITLTLKEDTEDEKYSSYLDPSVLRQLVTKYSDYVRYPIQMEEEVTTPKKDNPDETEIKIETQTLNSMIPLWKKNKNKIKPEEYNSFYQSKFMDWEDPQKVIHYNVEGTLSYTALLFLPAKTPFNYYASDYQSGLQLYSKGVFIMDCAKDLLPDYFRFVKGLVDSDDLNLNISREILQQDRQVLALKKSIEKKITSTLEDMLKNERSEYEKLFTNFGMGLKYGVYQDFGAHKESLQDLLLFHSSKTGAYTTLKEYVDHMEKDQKSIYYACGESLEAMEHLPQIEKVKDKGYEILYFIDDVDEFAIQMLREYDGKPFVSCAKADLDLANEEEKKELEEKTLANKDMLEIMKEALGDKVKEVRISSRLKSNPVCLVSGDNGVSIEMEKVLNQNPNGGQIKADKILELNPDHPLFISLKKSYNADKESVKEYADILYDQALLIEGLPIEDPVGYANRIADLMIKANQ